MFRRDRWQEGAALAAGELPTDPALPQLPELLDVAGARSLLEQHIGRGQVGACAIRFVHYVPGRSCLVCLQTRLPGDAEEIISAKAFADAPSDAWLARRRKRLTPRGAHAPEFGYLPARRLALACFPNDLRVHTLPSALHRKKLELRLRQVLEQPDLVLRPRSGRSPGVGLVSYKPERSCLFRCVVAGPGGERAIYARAYRDERGESVHGALGSLRRAGLTVVPEPLGYDPDARVLFQSTLPGRRLDELIDDGAADPAAPAAEALATLHRTPFRGGTDRTAERDLRAPLRVAGLLGPVFPEIAQRLVPLLERLAREPPDERSGPWGPLHGDFAPSQVLVEGNRAGLVDLDRVGSGDAHTDVGNFLARLDRSALERGWPEDRVRRVAEALESAYAAAGGRALRPERLRWHHALGLVRVALSAVQHLRPGWPARVNAFIERAEDVLRD